MFRASAILLLTLIAASPMSAGSGSLQETADSIRTTLGVPEFGYVVVSADSILEIQTLGFKRADAMIPAQPGDRFHLGSCTKAITGLVAGVMVDRGLIKWDSRFFDLCPELESGSNHAYSGITLVDLLSHRAWLQPMTEDEELPGRDMFAGNASDQRYQFVAWVLTLAPVETEEKYSYSNAGYSAAAVMLERASGKTWDELVRDLGKELDLDFEFSWPNIADTSQPWGHRVVDGKLMPVPPDDDYDLRWVEPAGDINMSITDYAKFLQMQLRGLRGEGPLLNQQQYEFLHSGVPDHYSIGWAWGKNKNGHLVSAHSGSAETFWCYARVVKDVDRAYAVFANCGSEDCDAAVRKLLVRLMEEYGD